MQADVPLATPSVGSHRVIAWPAARRGRTGVRRAVEAQAFALALTLHERGAFTWSEWAQTLAAVIGEVRQRGEPRRATSIIDTG
jgi:hypothetical protein